MPLTFKVAPYDTAISITTPTYYSTSDDWAIVKLIFTEIVEFADQAAIDLNAYGIMLIDLESHSSDTAYGDCDNYKAVLQRTDENLLLVFPSVSITFNAKYQWKVFSIHYPYYRQGIDERLKN